MRIPKWFCVLLTIAVPPVGGAFLATPLHPVSTTTAPKPSSSNQGMVSVIVKLKDASLAGYTGNIPGLPATRPGAGQKKLNLNSKASKDYLKFLDGKHQNFKSQALSKIPRGRITHDLSLVMNAVSMVVPADQVNSLESLPNVEAVYHDQLLQLNTDVTPNFLGADTVWSQLGGQESSGGGVIVGVLDTGIWPEHPSFSDPDPSGKSYASPPPPAPGNTRQCEFSGGSNPGPSFTCNNKLIGADRFMVTYELVNSLLPGEFTSARDDNGHGTHTSGTAAGNANVAASIFGVSRGIISGLAPRAHVIMYKVCGNAGCYTSDSAAAIQKAILDGVDVINFSISGGRNPYTDPVSIAFLDAYKAGVFVAASAGNSGPGPDTVDHREPWVMTVAASTANRAFQNTVILNGGALTLTGTSLTQGINTPTPVVSAADPPYNDPLCEISTADSAFTGKIVVCKRGVSGRVQKGFNVLQRGAVGMILYNQASSVTDVETDNHFLPTSHIQFVDGQNLLSFLTSNVGSTATMTAVVRGSQQADVMASFSSRGGSTQVGVSKPDVTAPGVQILAGHTPQSPDVAAGPQGQLFQAIAGTSMSSPHVAGSGALLVALHPDWTPGQIKSALMTTAWRNVVKEDGVTPANSFDYGSGRINLRVAGDPGATFEASGSDYETFAEKLYKANYPSLYVPNMPGAITVQRTLHSVLSKTVTWNLVVESPQQDLKVSVPRTLTLSAGGKKSFSISLDARNVPIGQTRFAVLKLTSGSRLLNFPITIVRGQPVPMSKTCTPESIPLKSTTTCTIDISNSFFVDSNIVVTDKLPSNLQLITSSVVGATTKSGNVIFTGVLPANQPPIVTIGVGSSPPGEYLPLSQFGIPPISGPGDEEVYQFNVPPFLFGGEVYTGIGVVTNGYVVLGTATGSDVSLDNQNFPNSNAPNNVLAPFWTDLNPAAGGAIRVDVLTDGSDDWIVIDWESVPEFSQPNTASFQIWIGINNDAHPEEDVSYAYGTIQGNGDLGLLSVGAENKFGNSGQNTYFNGAGTLPSFGTQLRVTTTPGIVSKRTIVYTAKGVGKGNWTNYAEMTGDTFDGTIVARFSGSVTK